MFHNHSTTGNIIVLYILIFKLLERSLEGNPSEEIILGNPMLQYHITRANYATIWWFRNLCRNYTYTHEDWPSVVSRNIR